MGSQSRPLKLPVLDFSVPDLKPGTLDWDSLKSEIRKALEEYGCFEALLDKVSQDLKQETMGALEELCDLPLQTKLCNVSKKPFHGYVGQFPLIPLFESIGFDDGNILDKVDGVTTVLWPEGHPTFSKTIQSYSEQLSELDQIVRRMILESLGLEKYMDEHMNSTKYLLRVMKYKEPETTKAKVGLTTHTDMHMVSILFHNQVGGLEIQTKDGEWITAELSSPHSFIVITGDSLHAWTNGRLHFPFHQVMMTGNEARYTIGLFSIPKAGYIIKAPEEVIDEEHPLLFKPFDHFEFVNFYYTEAGQRNSFPLRAFCGV